MICKNFPAYRSVSLGVFPGYDGDGSSAGGDGGTGGSGQPAAVTMEAVTELVKNTVNTTVNNAISGLKRKDLPAIITTALEPMNAQFAAINDGIAKLSGSSGSGGTGGQGGSGTGSSSAPTIPPEVNAQLKTLTDTVKAQGATITTLQTTAADATKRAETAERHAAIRSALSGSKFASDSAAQTAFMLLEPQVTRLDDGSLAAGNLPLADFVKDFFPREHAYLLQSTGASGSGASGTGGTRTSGGALKVDISEIKPGMTADKRSSALADIQAALVSNR